MIVTNRARRLPPVLALVASLVVGPAAAACAVEADGPAPAPAPRVGERHVVAISVDGLNPRALKRLGREGTPALHRLISDEGAGTLNARTQLEMTVTLPNHTSMVTGRRIKAARGGHGVTWNDDTVTRSVQQAAGHQVDSVFTQVHGSGGTTGVYSTKAKFELFERSWPAAVDRSEIHVEKDAAVVRALREDLASDPATFSFVHLGKPDEIGHHHRWMSPRYLRAVAKVDALIGAVLAQITASPTLRSSTVVVLTSDHGGVPGTTRHGDKRDREDYRVPFAIWGAGVEHASLYALNPDRAEPGRSRPGFGAPVQPIRNGELANVSLDVLGLGPVPGSLWNAGQDLDWR